MEKKIFSGIIVSKVIEANISFDKFVNLGHNSSTVTKTTWTYPVNLKDGETILPDNPNSERIWWKPSVRRENSEKSSEMIGSIISIETLAQKYECLKGVMKIVRVPITLEYQSALDLL